MKRYIKAAASEAQILYGDKKRAVASEIALNIKGEWDAIEGYQKLIPWFEQLDDSAAVDQVKEIISDELNHAEVLRKLMKKYDGGIKTNKS